MAFFAKVQGFSTSVFQFFASALSHSWQLATGSMKIKLGPVFVMKHITSFPWREVVWVTNSFPYTGHTNRNSMNFIIVLPHIPCEN